MLHLDPFTVPTVVLRRCDIVLCHDVGPLTHPDLFEPDVCRSYQAIYGEIAAVGPHIVFVSRASREAFAQLFPAARPASMTVIYPAIRTDVDRGEMLQPEGVTTPFLLTVGSIGARKNQARAIRAFGRSGLAARDVRYVLCGAQEPGFAEAAAVAAETQGVVLLPYVTDAALRWLYAHAAGFVLASLLEGFGVPVAEAIGRGLVPLVTRGSVLHEVAGDGALLVDAHDEAEIARAMVHLIDMPDEERNLRQAQLARAIERFTPGDFIAGWRRLLGEVLGPG